MSAVFFSPVELEKNQTVSPVPSQKRHSETFEGYLMEFHGIIKRMFIPEALSFKIESPSIDLMSVDNIVFVEPGSMCTSIFHA